MTNPLKANDDIEQNRAKIWVATMAGNVDDQVIRAHKGKIEYIPFQEKTSRLEQDTVLFDARSRCDLEYELLSQSATKSSVMGNRARIEVRDNNNDLSEISFRTNFEKDRDRILHSQAFRRLSGKTQVYLNPDDHQRTRLTHALEVAQIAKAISRSLRLNDVLTEAIALGHDCGHGPGGHASEDAFDIFLEEGFHHAIFGADVTLRHLNLCVETLDGIRNHSWSLNTPMTPEAEVVSFADRIAYVCHDLEDALSCNLITENDFPKDIKDFLLQNRGIQIDYFIRGVIKGTLESQSIAITKECGEMLAAMRKFNNEKIYQHELSQKQNQHVIVTLRKLVNHYLENYDLVPQTFRRGIDDQYKSKVRTVVEYVAGMTDQYAGL